MWQRNPTGEVRQVMTWPTEEDPERQIFNVGPGEEIDYPELLGGFILLDEPAEQTETVAPEPEAPSSEAPEETAAVAADEEEGEQE